MTLLLDRSRMFRTASEVAMLLGVHVNTVKRIPTDLLPYFRATERGDRRYRLDDVQTYIEARSVR